MNSDSVDARITKPLTDLQDQSKALEQKISSKTDSLFSTPRGGGASEKMGTVNDGLASITDNLENKLQQPIDRIEQRSDSLQQKVTSSANRLQEKIEKKLSSVSGEKTSLGDAPSTPGVPGMQDASIPSIDTAMPSIGDVPGINDVKNKIPGTEIPAIKSNMPSDALPDIKQNLPTEGLSTSDLPSVPELNADKLKDLQPDVQAATEKLEAIEKQSAEIQKAKENASMETLGKEAKSHLENTAEVKELAGGMAKANKMQTDHEAMVKRYQDKKKAFEELKRKTSSIANDKLAKNPELFKDAQDKLSTAKKAKEGAKKFDVLRLQSDEFEGKKFYHRLVPGVTFQPHSQQNFSADLGVQLGFRATPALTVGLGGSYRAYFDKSIEYFVTGAGVYGGRFYTSLDAVKGFYLHAEFESLKLNPHKFREPIKGDVSPHYFYGTNFGLGKRFNLSRKIKGNVLGLYRLEHEGYLPATQKIAVRMGFDYIIKKEKKLIPKVKR